MTKQEAYDQICSIAYHDCDIPLRDYTDVDDIEGWSDFDDIDVDRIIDEHCDIIYYSRAIDFLAKHDASLQESLAIADEYGYQTKDLNSELLASLLNGQKMREYWWNSRSEINDILSDIDEDEDDDE